MTLPLTEAEGNMTRINCPHCDYHTYKHLLGHTGMDMLQRHIQRTHTDDPGSATAEPDIPPPAA